MEIALSHRRLVVRVALLVLLMGVFIHGAIYLFQQKVIVPQMMESEQTKADVLLQAYLPVIVNAVQSGDEQQIQLLASQLGLVENPVTGNVLLDGLSIEAMDGDLLVNTLSDQQLNSFTSEAILFSSGETREMLGVVKLHYSREFFDLLNREALSSIMQLSLMTIALSILLLMVLAHYLKPLQILAESLKGWEVGGSPSQLPDLPSSASMEISLVHSAMSRLLDDLHSYQVSLEQLVFERTKELEQANQTLEDAHYRVTNQNQAFARLTKVDSADLPLKASLEEITEVAAATLDIERVSIWRFVDEGKRLSCVDLYQYSGDAHSKEDDLDVAHYPLYFKGIHEERALVMSDAQGDSRMVEFVEEYLVPLQIISMIDVPIRTSNLTIGVVCYEAVNQSRSWSVDEENFAIAVADFIALALESGQRRQVEADLRDHRDHLEEVVESRTAELQVANEKLKEEMVVREQLEKAEQYNAFQSGIAEMSATILHNIGNAVTGMRGSVEKSSNYLSGLTKIARSVDVMHERLQDGTLETAAVVKGLGLVSTTLTRYSGEEGIQGQLDKMDKGIFHIGEIINVYRSSSKLEINASRFNFMTMLKDSLQLIQDKFDKYNIELQIECPAELELTIPRNPAIQMLLNLVKNSVEAILERRNQQPSHQGKVTIVVRELSKDEITLTLTDNGCGIDAEMEKKIFSHGYTSKNYGSGYGLHSAANFISSIRGAIRAESGGVNQGATMHLTLPKIDQREKRLEGEENG
ncbi:MAG: GAF domain-containing protein [Gammaproteobacteria bacterium]|jgi:signal transduction histidine kinase|nr:GAF domain-containing protein [Gammaproteobacteria bacterium]MBT3488273.1 GAF domain-containing protein [Gammaproteobacteria bacterium]MBT3719898.1 GAF domain-containing protein [Gammaproteobacteria bacterium]MBT3843814.1 GAF domain-containing protein [Gammaproteobacteria bacterium]MBT3892093.1 GAF domain-containing protein [Gammaproteobacteria bacterium]